jgi:hypothetical protein
VNPDGLHFEQSTYYHVYALDLFLHAAILAAANGKGLPKELEVTLERMLQALSQVGAAGPPPRFGDDDGGRLFDPARNRTEHLLDPLATGSVLFHRSDFKQIVSGLREETIWLLGQNGVDEWDHLKTEEHSIAPASAGFESAGLYVLAAAGSQLLIRGGPSIPQSYGHNHADALSICLQSEGRSLLIDPGTGEYVGAGDTRNRFRGTAMHNTLRVDGEDQADPSGPFSWKNRACVRTEQWIRGQSFDLYVGNHDGYRRSPFPVVHHRCVLALKTGIFLVRDLAEGSGTHRLDISWHLAPELQQHQQHLFRMNDSARGLAIIPTQEHDWEEEFQECSWSPVYGLEQKATVLNFGIEVSLPAEFVSLLVPTHESHAVPGKFTGVSAIDGSNSVRAYRYQTDTHDRRFFFAPKDQGWEFGDVVSDAEFLCLSLGSGVAEPDIILCNGTYVSINGTRILSLKHRVEWCELINEIPGQIFGSDIQILEA